MHFCAAYDSDAVSCFPTFRSNEHSTLICNHAWGTVVGVICCHKNVKKFHRLGKGKHSVLRPLSVIGNETDRHVHWKVYVVPFIVSQSTEAFCGTSRDNCHA